MGRPAHCPAARSADTQVSVSQTQTLLWIVALFISRGEPPQVDLVGALGLPQLPVEAQRLRVRIDGPLGQVPVENAGILGCRAPID